MVRAKLGWIALVVGIVLAALAPPAEAGHGFGWGGIGWRGGWGWHRGWPGYSSRVYWGPGFYSGYYRARYVGPGWVHATYAPHVVRYRAVYPAVVPAYYPVYGWGYSSLSVRYPLHVRTTTLGWPAVWPVHYPRIYYPAYPAYPAWYYPGVVTYPRAISLCSDGCYDAAGTLQGTYPSTVQDLARHDFVGNAAAVTQVADARGAAPAFGLRAPWLDLPAQAADGGLILPPTDPGHPPPVMLATTDEVRRSMKLVAAPLWGWDGESAVFDTLPAGSTSRDAAPLGRLVELELPREAVSAADALFASGAYAQAASAYARLTVRFGDHEELGVRRFVALIASGDCEQAAVVFELAALNGRRLEAASFPGGSLKNLYAGKYADCKRHTEYLAQYALTHAAEATPLAMVGTWLQLDGQSERAAPFMQRAAAMAGDARDNTLPTPTPLLVSQPAAQ
jgi:hypothetical protein